jgi:hypothetical protein
MTARILLHGLLAAVSLVFGAVLMNYAHAQPVAPSDRPTVGAPLGPDALVSPGTYCPELKQVVAHASAQNQFASIAGKPREGNFLGTSLPLPGWRDCALYGMRTYTCDSRELRTVDEALKERLEIVEQIKACLVDWSEAQNVSSPSYVVLHSRSSPASITVSTDQKQEHEHVVRLTLFVRGG